MNHTEDEATERLRRGFAEFDRRHELGPDCPTHSAIWDAVTGQGDPAAVRKIVVHMANCPLCAESWRAAREVAREGAFLPPVTAGVEPASGWSWALAVAAALVMAVGGWLALRAVKPLPGMPGVPSAHMSPAQTPGAAAAPGSVGPAEPARSVVPAGLHAVKAPLRLSTSLLVTMRGESSNEGFLVEFGKAIEPYKRDDFAAAAAALGALEGRYPRVAEVAFYRGVSLLMAGQPREAILPLSNCLALAEDGQRDDAAWYLVVAQAQAGDPAQAARTARGLCSTAIAGEMRRQACHAAALLGGPTAR